LVSFEQQMNPTDSKPRLLSRRRKRVFVFITVTSTVILIAFVTEAVMRWTGFTPWAAPPLFAAVDPPGPYFRAHPTRGFAHVPGQLRLTLMNDYSFRVTHLSNGLRITHPLADPI